jgi:hypothetical protein
MSNGKNNPFKAKSNVHFDIRINLIPRAHLNARKSEKGKEHVTFLGTPGK